ncbi:transglycosylase family protein [Streptomyces sp. NPDC093984]|uniref:LysM peptidoglycan-binding domain-containing protein n=1 Tax=Streptomyces sp. NPDC093984 TaxID=3366052 RepID=UPI0038105E68
MLSGNGRHRRPRQAPALLVAAGVTGSAIAIPLLGATGASAATGTTWDQVAECVSGGSWSADTGNGHYGGLQLTQDDWDKYGGLDYAPTPDQASRSQQIAVAEKVLAARGVGVWGTCGLLNGLSKDSGSADVDTGVAGDSSSHGGSSSDSGLDSGLSDSPGSSASTTSSPSSSSSSALPSSPSPSSGGSTADTAKSAQESGSAPTATTKDDESDKSAQNDASSGASSAEASGAGRHRGDSAEESAAGGRTSDASGRHASRGTADARDAVDGSYTVRPGDNLSSIADSLDVSGGWTSLYEANKQTVGADPNLILPGQSLALDADPTGGSS